MLRVLERDPHALRLQDLLQRFRAQEGSMTAALQDLQAELELHHREANVLRGTAPEAASAVLRRCTELQTEWDAVATELVHVRMAVAGAAEELAEHHEKTSPPRTVSLPRTALA